MPFIAAVIPPMSVRGRELETSKAHKHRAVTRWPMAQRRHQLSPGGAERGFLQGERLALSKSLLSPRFRPSVVPALTVIRCDRLPLLVLLPGTEQGTSCRPWNSVKGPEDQNKRSSDRATRLFFFFPLIYNRVL